MQPPSPHPIPDYEEWSHYCLTLGHADFMNTSGDSGKVVENRIARFLPLTPRCAAEYVTRLFENSHDLSARYTPDQIGEATWFIFGIASGYFHKVRSPANPVHLQLRCFQSVTTLYLDLYDKLCNHKGFDWKDCSGDQKLDCAVYMIWDMDCIEGAVLFPDESRQLFDAGLAILETVLAKCRTGSCLKSALHALGHIHTFHPEHAEKIIDSFLTLRGHELPEWLADYAQRARIGAVQ